MKVESRHRFFGNMAALAVFATGRPNLFAQQARPRGEPTLGGQSVGAPGVEVARRSGGGNHIHNGVYYFSGTGSNDGYSKDDHVIVTDPFEKYVTRTFAKKPKLPNPSVDGSPIVPITTGLGSTGDIYAELGVTPLININGTVTVIGGSVMKPEVMELIRRGNEHFVMIDELEIAAGKFIAKLCKSPAGYTGPVTGGAAAAMVVAYAGMMTEDLEPRIKACPGSRCERDARSCPGCSGSQFPRERYPRWWRTPRGS